METKAFRFAYGETRLGTALAAVGDKGLIAVLLGDSKDYLYRELRRCVPQGDLIEDAASLAETLAKVVLAVNAPGAGFDLPLDMHGSGIEMAVWQSLRQIPAGETRSYGQIAKALPVAATAQEVGAACAANVLAVLIPCHRVVKADGSISGYRWGVSRKRQLLAMERAACVC
jgi:AraC family transcriptional regulator of adaptative response/methylated-DNA-[protein]-cysteine methyltransferase